jgi:hypothetical protein
MLSEFTNCLLLSAVLTWDFDQLAPPPMRIWPLVVRHVSRRCPNSGFPSVERVSHGGKDFSWDCNLEQFNDHRIGFEIRSKYSEGADHLRQTRSDDSVTDLTYPICLIHKRWLLQDFQSVSVLSFNPGDIVFVHQQHQ